MTALEEYEAALEQVKAAVANASLYAANLDFHKLLPVGSSARLTGSAWEEFDLLGEVVEVTGHEDEGPVFQSDGAGYVIYSGPDDDYAAVPYIDTEDEE